MIAFVFYSESMDYINEKALEDNNTSIKFALLFSSRFFDSLAMNSLKVRSKMMSLLEMNYQQSQQYFREDKRRLYNSITLLGECFHRIRTSQNDPIHILGKSLLNLLTKTINEDAYIDQALARVILSQVTLNGKNLKFHHKEEVDELLFHVRRNLIEQNDLTDTVKALLLMTLDVHNNNITNLNKDLLTMYTDYLKQADNSPDNVLSIAINTSPRKVKKKWSEQVVEELYNDTNFENDNNSISLFTSVTNKCEHDWKEPRYKRNESNKEKKSIKKQTINNDEDNIKGDGGSLRLYTTKNRFRYDNCVSNCDDEKRYQSERNMTAHSTIDDIDNFKGHSNIKKNDFCNKRNSENYRNNNSERPPRFRQKGFQNSWRNNNIRAISQTRECYSGETSEYINNYRLYSRTKPLSRNAKQNDNERKSVSPSTVLERRPQQSRKLSNNCKSRNSNRYYSQSSLASDSILDCNHNKGNDYGSDRFRKNKVWNRKSHSNVRQIPATSKSSDDYVNYPQNTSK